MLEVLNDDQGKLAVDDLVKQWNALDKLKNNHQIYIDTVKINRNSVIVKLNQTQHELRKTFNPFFESLHDGLKQLDKIVRQHENDSLQRKS